MIEVKEVTKRYGSTIAVDRLSFSVQPGIVTGFLGPNGAGKSTTMRMMVGLDHPNAGSITVGGRAYRDLPAPMHEVGALLDARAIQGGRAARQHLAWMARAGGLPGSRVDEVLELVGLQEVAGRKAGGFSLGMSQRLGIAGALLGDPKILLFDEPVNGLDPDGIRWVRSLLRELAAEGRTILVSSHLMSEMQEVADHIVVIGRGKLVADASLDEIRAHSRGGGVCVASPQADGLMPLLTGEGAHIENRNDGVITVSGIEAARIGELAAANGIVLHELAPQRASLEAAFFELTRASVEYRTDAGETEIAETARAVAEAEEAR